MVLIGIAIVNLAIKWVQNPPFRLSNLEKGILKMEKRNASATTGGIGFSGVLTVAFIILKLCGVIKWSWLWVLSPIWIPVALVVLILLVVVIKAVIDGTRG